MEGVRVRRGSGWMSDGFSGKVLRRMKSQEMGRATFRLGSIAACVAGILSRRREEVGRLLESELIIHAACSLQSMAGVHGSRVAVRPSEIRKGQWQCWLERIVSQLVM